MINRRVFLARTGGIATLSCLPAWSVASAAPPAAAGLRTAGFDAWVRCRMEEAHIPGLSLAIIDAGRLVRSAAFGWADLERKRPMRTSTLINIASVTKTITCAAVMQLWEQGKFALDEDVNRFLPFAVRNPNHPDSPLTFRQLLSHSSSIADGPAYEDIYACGDHPVALGAWLRDYLSSDGGLYDPQRNFHDWVPGSRASYSNIGFGLLGYLVEILSGIPYTEYCERRIFAPLGMVSSRFLLAGMPPEAHATPYTYGETTEARDTELRDPSWQAPRDGRKTYVPLCLYSFVTSSDGLVRTSADELPRFLMAILDGGAYEGARILRPETVALILSDQKVRYAPSEGSHARDVQGLAWFGRHDAGPQRIWSHSGGDPGIGTHVSIRPADRRGALAFTNIGEDNDLRKDIARLVLGEKLQGVSRCKPPAAAF